MAFPPFAEQHMRRAIEVARGGWGTTYPNPIVGAVIADGETIVAEGFHSKAGEPHAEVNAFAALDRKVTPSMALFVTMEPCCTQGLTPPCTDAIIGSGIKTVFVGATDPNPIHAGRGLDVLRAAGITVQSGVLEDECNDLNLIFNHWMSRRLPFVAGKIATTIDGYIATRAGESKWITGELARQDVMRWRAYFPAIMTAAGTVRTDNPRLTIRNVDPVRCPRRIIVDPRLAFVTDPLPNVYGDEFVSQTIVCAYQTAFPDRKKRLIDNGATVWEFPMLGDGGIDLGDITGRCAEEEIQGVFVEGGAELMTRLVTHRYLNYLLAYRAPRFFGDPDAQPFVEGQELPRLADAFHLTKVRLDSFGDDQLMRGFVNYPTQEIAL